MHSGKGCRDESQPIWLIHTELVHTKDKTITQNIHGRRNGQWVSNFVLWRVSRVIDPLTIFHPYTNLMTCICAARCSVFLGWITPNGCYLYSAQAVLFYVPAEIIAFPPGRIFSDACFPSRNRWLSEQEFPCFVGFLLCCCSVAFMRNKCGRQIHTDKSLITLTTLSCCF